MDAGTADFIVKMVSSLGFPIVMCGVLVWMMNKRDKAHAEESAKWVEALNNNTEAMNRIIKAVEKEC